MAQTLDDDKRAWLRAEGFIDSPNRVGWELPGTMIFFAYMEVRDHSLAYLKHLLAYLKHLLDHRKNPHGARHCTGPDDTTLSDLCAEVEAARAKFPEPYGLGAALAEEIGEWGDAVALHYRDGRRKEKGKLLQVACVAIRLYEEADPLMYHPEMKPLIEAVKALEPLAREILAKIVSKEAAARSLDSP